MKIYIVSVLSVLIFTGCDNIDFNVQEKNGTEVVNLSPATPSNPVPSTGTTNTAEETSDTTEETTTQPQIIEKREISETLAKEWYVRIVVEDTTNNMKTASAQLGQVETANAVSKHTLKAIAPFRPTFLDVVFVNPDGVDTGSYKTNFHPSSTDADMWEFTVKSHDANADMILGWRGLYVLTSYIDDENRERYKEYKSMTNPLLSYMTLLDVATNTEIDVLSNGTVNEYVFNMDGSTQRVFRWKLKDSSLVLKDKVKTLKHAVLSSNKKRLKQLQIQALRKDAKAKPDTLKKRRLDALDMTTPPTFEVLVK